MTESTYNLIILIAGGIIAGLLWINHKQALNLKDLVPADLTAVLLNLLGDLASKTTTPADDELVGQLRLLLADAVAQKTGVDGKP